MGIVVDHGSRVITPAGESPRRRHELSTCAGDCCPRRSGYRRVGSWRSPLLGWMVRWAREFALPEDRAAVAPGESGCASHLSCAGPQWHCLTRLIRSRDRACERLSIP